MLSSPGHRKGAGTADHVQVRAVLNLRVFGSRGRVRARASNFARRSQRTRLPGHRRTCRRDHSYVLPRSRGPFASERPGSRGPFACERVRASAERSSASGARNMAGQRYVATGCARLAMARGVGDASRTCRRVGGALRRDGERAMLAMLRATNARQAIRAFELEPVQEVSIHWSPSVASGERWTVTSSRTLMTSSCPSRFPPLSPRGFSTRTLTRARVRSTSSGSSSLRSRSTVTSRVAIACTGCATRLAKRPSRDGDVKRIVRRCRSLPWRRSPSRCFCCGERFGGVVALLSLCATSSAARRRSEPQ